MSYSYQSSHRYSSNGQPNGNDPRRMLTEVNSLQRQAEELDRQIEAQGTMQEEELNRLVDDVRNNTRREIQDRCAELTNHVQRTYENQLDGLRRRGEEHNVQARDNVKRMQSQIFKTNRIFREVARELQDGEWQAIFRILMARHPREDTEAEISVIEGEGKLMQGYKSLVRWKELRPDEFSLERLIEVLRDSGRFDAADKAASLLYSDDGYMIDPSNVTSLPQANQARVNEILANVGRSVLHGGEEQAAMPQGGATYASQNSGPINNRRLLLISKKLTDHWEELARRLGLPDTEIRGISDLMNGDGQQCAFQTLYKWRDAAAGSDVENAKALASILRSMGLDDVASHLV